MQEEGDAVSCWKSQALGLILFLTAETLRQVYHNGFPSTPQHGHTLAALLEASNCHEENLVPFLLQAKALAEELNSGLVLMVNPQWQTGQLISDLGFGPWRKRNEEFIDSFQNVYSLKRLRYSRPHPSTSAASIFSAPFEA